MVIHGRFIQWFNFDETYQRMHQIVKKDPYRYILSDKEYNNAYHRVKRALIVLGLPALYVYKHIRYHNELGQVKKMKITSIQLLQIVPRLLLSVVFLYPLTYAYYVDYDKIKLHDIAKRELQKFDRDWFTYDDFKYVVHNAPAYNGEDSAWGRLYLKRLLYNYNQEAGWIRRLKEKNWAINAELPPRYDFTPEGPRKTYRFSEEARRGDVSHIINKGEYN